MIPLISSMCRGPLGVRQLPRTWWKVVTREAGLLDRAYPDCSRELDDWCLKALELDRERTLAYLRDAMPTYLEFESWVLEQRGGRLNLPNVDRWNEGVTKRVHVNPGKIDETYGDIGFDRSEVRVSSAVILNCMQDWALFYGHDFAAESSGLSAPVAPLISSIDYGSLGVCQLPRTWLKVLLKARGLLHPDYPDYSRGLDAGVLDVLKLDPDTTLGYLRESLPSYLDFEAWVLRQSGGSIDRDAVDAWNRLVFERKHSETVRAPILATLGRKEDGALTSAVVLNHLEDWHFAHTGLMERLGR